MVGCCEQGSEPLGFRKGWEILQQLSNCLIFKKKENGGSKLLNNVTTQITV
jgi:hypothetical protein